MKTKLALSAISLCYASSVMSHNLQLTQEDYQDKVEGAWLGQMIGNFYGLSYEFKYIEEPGPDQFPYGFGSSLQRLDEVDGAFSDDDTDIEYMYLIQMEEHGIEPTYQQLAQAWQYHVTDRVWAANRQAVALMRTGVTPPLSGAQNFNSEWFQIDPQLVNEIWAITAPGMIDYAVDKTEWAAKITNDGFGVEPAMHYAAMYSAAFFEDDIETLINIASSKLPREGRYRQVVEEAKALHRKYPDNWQAARAEIANRYAQVFDYNPNSWVAIDATLNGALGILALLYGEGDFQKTLDYSSAMGYDADNQAATLSGLLGIIGGKSSIPEELLFPFGKERWSQPFNDKYINVSRHDLPDAGVQDIMDRITAQGVEVVSTYGSVSDTGHLVINSHAEFTPPLELPGYGTPYAEVGRSFDIQIAEQDVEVIEGALPQGLKVEGGRILGAPSKAGVHNFRLSLAQGDVTQDYILEVASRNLALTAESVSSSAGGDTSLLTDTRRSLVDGKPSGESFYSNNTDTPEPVTISFEWSEIQDISTIKFNNGYVLEDRGWFESVRVFARINGVRQAIDISELYPAANTSGSKYGQGKYIEHTIRLSPIKTDLLEIEFTPDATAPDDGTPIQYSISLSEMSVHQ